MRKITTDKNGKTVYEGDSIKFKRSERIYKVINENGHLGCYEDGEFIPLCEILKNFEIVKRTGR
ncbi:hypothetical protein J36TS2_39650 [Bacillus paralicheniformis]|nr:hypothetical protein J36TS2_39650 [Bacillus paralicheniformis]